MEASTTRAIVDALTRAIVDHRLQPGSKLAEQKLADQLRRLPHAVRQALLQLAQNRLVTLGAARTRLRLRTLHRRGALRLFGAPHAEAEMTRPSSAKHAGP